MMRSMNKLPKVLLENLRLCIVLICCVLFAILWNLARHSDPSSATGSLWINLAATAVSIAFTVLLIDWLQEQRQRLLVAKPLTAAKQALDSICLSACIVLGARYLSNFSAAMMETSSKDTPNNTDHLTSLQRNLIDKLHKIKPDDYLIVSAPIAADLAVQLDQWIVAIDETLRLYAYALDPELRDSVYSLRDKMVILRDVFKSFKQIPTQDIGDMQHITGLQLQKFVQAIRDLKLLY
jgi:hypothetical protein